LLFEQVSDPVLFAGRLLAELNCSVAGHVCFNKEAGQKQGLRLIHICALKDLFELQDRAQIRGPERIEKEILHFSGLDALRLQLHPQFDQLVLHLVEDDPRFHLLRRFLLLVFVLVFFVLLFLLVVLA